MPRAVVAVKGNVPVGASDQQVEIAVAVQIGEARRPVTAGALDAEQAGAFQREGWCLRRPVVAEEQGGAGMVADEQVEIAVTVDVHESGKRAARADVGDPERIGAVQREGRRQRRSGVSEVERVAVCVADEQVEIAVAVEVGQHRSCLASDVGEAEAVGADHSEGRIRHDLSAPRHAAGTRTGPIWINA
ncbi:hypothetical protein FHW79_003454 [Azospirillum sp. OGB3]|nr:hypothetical protein [Azospirillum sp. OGB3]